VTYPLSRPNRTSGSSEYQSRRTDSAIGRKIFAPLTVRENLEMGAYTRENLTEVQQFMERAFASFPRLKERLDQLGGTLSGGEQQMLATARGLMSRPTLLLLDEPSMGLSPIMVEAIFKIIQEINAQGTTPASCGSSKMP
jgi:branched-chain amino acid transport system ATP-binding protein